MAIFVTGDVHGGAEYGSSRFSSKSWPDGRTLSRDDVVVVAGDFGFVWDGSNTDRYWLDWFESKPWTTCFVDGNHENHRMLAELPETEWNGGRVHVARPHVLHLMRGEVFDIAGTTVLAMGGAASHDREWRKEGKSWWPEEMPSETEMKRCRRNLDAAGHGLHELGYLLVLLGELVDEGGERWRIGSARPLVTVYLLCISVCITLCIRRLLVKRIDEPANQISL